MTALFNFQSLLLVILLIICTSTYAHSIMPGIMDRNQNGFFGIFWKCARVGERLSPYVSLCCIAMAVSPPSALEDQPKCSSLFALMGTQVSLFIGS
ncbi:hypothetical protein CPC735_034670 [Coccidioides posadasii C735 delta SOWgp]|uniref:Protein kish n=1 Tax=Coccidioides posadasii (strain C735) TaxID=222929 RepID=C5P5Z1_COCP7|nr:hypothetical protein CPC735_034670 [Coccidioides posadasii C735 delta SOWgp]EER28131.1 hypothetical protein CPC735_034670 [Coccidioides posadasii C735 delta SOWgp]|eukprot:XP_003070276.1 hypothetical protein CPC735_034670 [Coccidioides posadasii C735 delta SOWgp]